MTRRQPRGIPTGGRFATSRRPEAGVDLSESVEPKSVEPTGLAAVSVVPGDGFRCEDCDELSSGPGPALYECSRCGQSQVDDRRCTACNVFMAKVSDGSCTVCEESGDLTPTPVWDVGGALFESAEAAQQWVDDAPLRDEQHIKAQQFLDDHLKAARAKDQARVAAVRPRIEEALKVVNETDHPRMGGPLARSLESFDDRKSPDFYLVPIDMGEVVASRFPEHLDQYRAATDRDRDWDERQADAASIRTAIIASLDLRPEFVDRLDDWSTGVSPVVDIEDALDLLTSPKR